MADPKRFVRIGGLVFVCLALYLVFLAISQYLRPEVENSSSVGEIVSAPAPVSVNENQQSVVPDSPDAHPIDPALELAGSILESLRRDVRDYTATLVKRERIGGKLGAESKLDAKIRTRSLDAEGKQRGLAVYLKFTEPSSVAGREVIWVEGENDNKLISHETGFKNFTRLYLAPDGLIAMLGNKYPLTEIGLTRMVEKLIEKGKEDRARGDCEVAIIDGQRVGDRPCKLIQVTHPKQDGKYDFHIAQIFIDTQRSIPLRYAAFLWPEQEGESPPLEEEYTYLDVQLNVGLQESDFDPDNPDYNYP